MQFEISLLMYLNLIYCALRISLLMAVVNISISLLLLNSSKISGCDFIIFNKEDLGFVLYPYCKLNLEQKIEIISMPEMDADEDNLDKIFFDDSNGKLHQLLNLVLQSLNLVLLIQIYSVTFKYLLIKFYA